MSVYIKFSEAKENNKMNIDLLKEKDGELIAVSKTNDIEPNACEIFGMVLFHLIQNDAEGINDVVFKAMNDIMESFSAELRDSKVE